MNLKIMRNRKYLTDLFAGRANRHAIIMNPEFVNAIDAGDFLVSNRPVKEWVPWALKNYELKLKWLEELDDDSVPYINLATTTGIFAASFGCPLHLFKDSLACALPIVETVHEADKLKADFNAPMLERFFELAELVRSQVGADVPISVPDIQSPFDIAALIWRKEDFFTTLYEEPDAVKRLVNKCLILLKNFLTEFIKRFPECNLCHYPYVWAPPSFGCWLSEDEAGSISPKMFDEFCLSGLKDLSETFGGLFMHCCATADHQYNNFRKIPNLRGLNRTFQSPGPRPAIETFSGHTVLIITPVDVDEVYNILDMALPDTRFVFDMPEQPIEDAKRTYEHIYNTLKRLPRTEQTSNDKFYY